jgi:phytoene/squalene synthetase
VLELYDKVCDECSKVITNRYSTSFSLGIKLFSKELRSPIYAIYGFVRFADEIVDTFHEYDKKLLLNRFREDTRLAIEEKISLNPVLQAFQKIVNEYDIAYELIESFLDSMAMDLDDITYDNKLYNKYIYGSAEVVGLMCLKVFLKDSPDKYNDLKESAQSLGSAFQKINFLRDIRDDYYNKGRTYFPNLNLSQFDDDDKRAIEKDIAIDFEKGLRGISKLPQKAKFGVFIAYIFYYQLFKKIRSLSFENILQERVRIKNRKKVYLLAKYSLKNRFNMI